MAEPRDSPETADSSEALDGPGAAPGDPTFRLASIEDAPAMLGVLESAFDRWPAFDLERSPLDHLRWKMSAPGLPAAHVVAEADGEIVGVSVRWVSRLRLGDDVLVQDSGVDQAVSPSMQGRGVGGRMAALAHERAVTYSDMALGTGSNDPRIPSIFDRFDPTDVHYPLTVRARPFEARTFVATHLRGGGRAHLLRSVLRQARRARVSRPTPADGVRIEELTQFDERVAPLWEAFAARFDFAVERTAEYLNWRYCDRRGGRRTVFAAFEGDRMLGYVVFRRSGDWSDVLDLVVDPDHAQASAIAIELLDAGCTRMRESGARGATLALSAGHPAGPVVEAAGFLPAGWSMQFGCGPQRRGYEGPLLERLYAGTLRTHLMYGDADIF